MGRPDALAVVDGAAVKAATGLTLPARRDAIVAEVDEEDEEEEGTASLLILLLAVPPLLAWLGAVLPLPIGAPALALLFSALERDGVLGLASSSSSSFVRSKCCCAPGGSGSQLSFLPVLIPRLSELASGLISISCSSAAPTLALCIETVVLATRSFSPGESSSSLASAAPAETALVDFGVACCSCCCAATDCRERRAEDQLLEGRGVASTDIDDWSANPEPSTSESLPSTATLADPSRRCRYVDAGTGRPPKPAGKPAVEAELELFGSRDKLPATVAVEEEEDFMALKCCCARTLP